MKKFLPVILFLLGIGVVGTVIFFVVKSKKPQPAAEDEVVAEIPFDQRPFVSMTPREDGHYLDLLIENIVVEAYSLDYEILYQTADNITQGVPGTVKLEGKSVIEKEVLLGSESSGKFRYDEGVEEGTLTLRFRNEKGKLVGKLSTQWHFQTDVTELTSLTGNFSYTLDEEADGVYFITMETFGLPQPFEGAGSSPYGVFASEEGPYSGEVSGANQIWDGNSWEEVSGSSSDIGVFLSF